MHITDQTSAAIPRFPEFVGMMAFLMALTALAIDMMLPALPQVHADFVLPGVNDQQLVLTLYFLGFAVGQLVHGPLSDRYGRKPVLLAGLAVFAAAGVMCLVAQSFQMLLLARFIQGAANAAPRIVALAIIRDRYDGRRMAEVMSFVMMVFITAPAVAPSIGSLFLLAGSWHLIFAFLALLGLVGFVWVGLRLPETHPVATREPVTLAWLGIALGAILTSRQTLGYALATAFTFGALMGYINSVQQVLVEIYGVGNWFSLIFGSVAIALAVASLLNGRYVSQLGMRRIGHGAMIGFVLSSAAHLGVYLVFGTPPLLVFLGMLSLCMFFFGLVMPNFNALAMEPMGRFAGTASSVTGFLTTGIASVAGLMIGQSYAGTVLPLLCGFALLGTAGLVIVWFTEGGKLFQPAMR